VVNAGGVIHLTMAAESVSSQAIDARIRQIGDTLRTVFQEAEALQVTPLAAAERFALLRIESCSG
jgi:leucine dehydrogenase